MLLESKELFTSLQESRNMFEWDLWKKKKVSQLPGPKNKANAEVPKNVHSL